MMNLFPAGASGLRLKTDGAMRNLFGRSQHESQVFGQSHGANGSAGSETLQCLEGYAQVSQG